MLVVPIIAPSYAALTRVQPQDQAIYIRLIYIVMLPQLRYCDVYFTDKETEPLDCFKKNVPLLDSKACAFDRCTILPLCNALKWALKRYDTLYMSGGIITAAKKKKES